MIEHYLSLLLTDVAAGRLTLDRVVELTATAPARLVNLYPRKGAIAAGSDADLVIVDPARRAVIRAADAHAKCGWTNLEGREVTGVPIATILRGTVIARDGAVLVEPGFGEPVTPVRAAVHGGVDAA
jgi:dihydroorotase-like cyclic amidohydrolase